MLSAAEKLTDGEAAKVREHRMEADLLDELAAGHRKQARYLLHRAAQRKGKPPHD